MTSQIERRLDFSGGIQNGTTWQLRNPNQVEDAINGRFGEVIGAIIRRYGYEREGNILESGKTGLGLTEGKWLTGSQIMGASNNAGDTQTVIKSYDPNTGNWTALTTPDPIDPDTKVQFSDSLNETYVAGKSSSTDNRMEVLNIVTSDDVVPVIEVSNTKNLLNCPKSRFITEYGGSLYAINCEIGGKIYADRAYKSSPALDIVTFIQGDQSDVAAPVDLLDQVPTMTSDSAPSGTAIASGEPFGAPLLAYSAFDDTNSTRWATNAISGWVGYNFGSGNSKVITYYSLVGLGDNDPSTGVEPKSWTFEGSNNGSTWTVLDTQTNAAAFSQYEKRVYTISNTTAYQYYRINVSTNQLGSGNMVVTELELLTSSQGTKDNQLLVDSVRYMKVGMSFEVYKAGTNTKLFDFTIVSVDKPKNTITFTPYNLSFTTGNVNTGTDTITLSDTSNFPTGQTIKFSSTGTVPAGLTADTLYYAINTSPTTIKVAASYNNALLGNPINITSTGTGSHTLRLSYTASDNDEIWLSGRFGKLTYLWNTDYPTEQKADYLRIPPSVDADSEITAYAKTNNRLFLFTKNSVHKWDGANFPNVYEDIGCIAHNSIQNIGDWILWLDAEGKIRARNDSTGQDELISRPIKNIIADIPEANLEEAAAGRIDNTYKLCLGTVDGSVLRVVYDFDTNTWAHDIHSRPMTAHVRSSISGVKKLYFLSNTGRMYVDDTGDLDDTDSIPFIVTFGRTMNRSEQTKNYHGIYVYSGNASGAAIKYTIDDADKPQTAGQLKYGVDKIPFSNHVGQARGRDINVSVSFNTKGDRSFVSGVVYYFSQEEDKFGQPT